MTVRSAGAPPVRSPCSGTAIDSSVSVHANPAALRRSDSPLGVDAGPTHQENGRPVPLTRPATSVIRCPASDGANRAAVTEL